MAGISGIGSGMDIDGIVKAMVAAERAPRQTQLANLEKTTTTRITAIGALKSAIGEFQKALSALDKPELFQARAASSSKGDLLGVTATTSAGVGRYTVQVSQLASGSKVALAAVRPPEGEIARFGSGVLNVAVGGSEPLSIVLDEGNDTLAGIRDAINKGGGELGLSATIVTDAYGPRLVLSSSRTGAGEDIRVEVVAASGTGNVALDSLAYPPSEGASDAAGARQITPASSARLTIDGLPIESSSNSIGQAIEGVTLELKGISEGAGLTVDVGLDRSGVKANVQKFVDAYNKLIGVVNSQTRITPVGDGKAPVVGVLAGDATARTLLNSIRNELVAVQSNDAIRALSDIGVTTQKDGTLSLEAGKLDEVLGSHFEALAGLFAGEKGLASRLDAKLQPYTQTAGILEQRNKAMTETIARIDRQKADLERRMTSLQERLFKQYNAMDSLLGQLSSTSSSLTAMFDALPGIVTRTKK